MAKTKKSDPTPSRSVYNLRSQKGKEPEKGVSNSSHSIPTISTKQVKRQEAKKSTLTKTPRMPKQQRTEVHPSTSNPATQDHDLDNLVGIDDIKEMILEDVVCPFLDPERCHKLNFEAPRGILLVGKPGTGKTALAASIANEIRKEGINVNFYVETGESLNQYLGETEKSLRDLFQRAHDNQPSIIFMDELDGLARRRSAGRIDNCPTILTTLLTQIGRIERGKVLLIAATNCPELVDPALIRLGRFDLTFELEVPDLKGRRMILSHYFVKYGLTIENKNLQDITRRLPGLTGAELEAFVKSIYREARRRAFPGNSWMKKHTNDNQFEKAKKNMGKVMFSDIQPVLATFQKNIQIATGGNNGNAEE